MLIKALKLVTSITTFPEGFGGLTPGEKETVELAHKQIIACCIKHSRGNQFARKLLEICPEQWPLILEKEIEYLCKSFEVNTVYNAEIAALTAFGNRLPEAAIVEAAADGPFRSEALHNIATVPNFNHTKKRKLENTEVIDLTTDSPTVFTVDGTAAAVQATAVFTEQPARQVESLATVFEAPSDRSETPEGVPYSSPESSRKAYSPDFTLSEIKDIDWDSLPPAEKEFFGRPSSYEGPLVCPKPVPATVAAAAPGYDSPRDGSSSDGEGVWV